MTTYDFQGEPPALQNLCPKLGLPHKYWPQGNCQYCGELAPPITVRDAEIVKLREELAATYAELIDHNGDDLNDTRAKRIVTLIGGSP